MTIGYYKTYAQTNVNSQNMRKICVKCTKIHPVWSFIGCTGSIHHDLEYKRVTFIRKVHSTYYTNSDTQYKFKYIAKYKQINLHVKIKLIINIVS